MQTADDIVMQTNRASRTSGILSLYVVVSFCPFIRFSFRLLELCSTTTLKGIINGFKFYCFNRIHSPSQRSFHSRRATKRRSFWTFRFFFLRRVPLLALKMVKIHRSPLFQFVFCLRHFSRSSVSATLFPASTPLSTILQRRNWFFCVRALRHLKHYFSILFGAQRARLPLKCNHRVLTNRPEQAAKCVSDKSESEKGFFGENIG